MHDSAMPALDRLHNAADTMHLRLFTVDAPRLEAGRWSKQHVRSAYWRFYRNEDDGAYIVLPENGGERFPLQAGRVYFVPAEVHFSCGNDAPFRHFYVHFDVVGLPRLTMRSLFGGPVALPHDTDFEEQIAAFARQVRASPLLDLGTQCRAKALIYEGFARHLDTLSPEERAAGLRLATELEPVAPAIRHIETRLSETLPVAELAALCCLSPDHFARRFKGCVGQTPLAYITERRITRAAQQLLFTHDGLDAIALSCGFGTREYLTRVFTRAVGIPPAAYRKSGRL
jgi:AraC-like DNA-binding protein